MLNNVEKVLQLPLYKGFDSKDNFGILYEYEKEKKKQLIELYSKFANE